MGTALTGLEIKDTYTGLIKTTDNGALTSLKALSDGLGNDSTLSLSTTAASIAGTLAVTGNATFDTNTLFVDAANNKVSIGNTIPSSFLANGNQLVVGSGAAAQGITIYSDTAGTGNLFFADGTAGDTAYRGFLRYDHADDSMLIYTNGANERMRITSAGNVGIGTSTPAYKLSVSGKLGVGASFNSVLAVATFDKATAVNTFTTASNYLQIGAGENAASSTRLIGFGYSITANTNQPAYIGYIETSNSAETKGDLIFGTRDVTTDTAPTERMRITSAGTLAVTGAATFDTTTLVVDATNNRVGVGTASPANTLDVAGTGRIKSSVADYLLTIENIKDDSQGLLVRASDNDSVPILKLQSSVGATSETWVDRFVVNKDGNVGIGTSAPSAILDVRKPTASGDTQFNFVNSQNSSSGNTSVTSSLYLGFTDDSSGLANANKIVTGKSGDYTSGPNANSFLAFYTTAANSTTEKVRITSAGNVGIGTTSPTSTLDVTGTLAVSSNTTLTSNGISLRLGSATSNAGANILIAGASSTKNWSLGVQQNVSGALEFTPTATNGATTLGTTPAMVILDGGNVGIGTTAPLQKLGIDGSIVLQSSTVATQSLIFRSPSSNWSPQNSRIDFIPADGANASVDISINLWNGSVGNTIETLRFPYTGGIQFPATQIASANANTLDDYEEGTWTMGVSFGGLSVGVTTSSNTGTYTKVGRQVTVNGYLALSSKGSSTGTALLTGLPFTIANGNSFYSTAGLQLGNVTFTNQYSAIGAVNTTTIELYEATILGVVTVLTAADFANDSNVTINFTYFV